MVRFPSRSSGELVRFRKRIRRRGCRVRRSSTQRSRAHTASYFLLDPASAAPLDIASTCGPHVADSVSAFAQHDSVASDVGKQKGSPAPAVDSTGLADALPFLLSRTRQLDLDIHDVCSILCCCREYADIVEHHCSGSLVVELPDPCGEAAMGSFAEWLPGHGDALQSLVVGDLSITPSLRAEGRNCPVFLSLALPAIAASCVGWKLRQYISTSPDSSNPIILMQLPSSHLTHLQIILPEDSQCPGVSEAFSIIGQLSKLARLQITSNHPAVEQSESGCVVSLSPLGSLKHLTALQLDKVVSFSGLGELQHLPASIQDLHISVPACTGHHEHLGIDHLTALRSLSIHSSVCYCLWAEDCLPACLRNVRIGYCKQLQPLLQLTELQELSLINTPDTELAQITALTTLTKLALTYDSPIPMLYVDVWADLAMLREVTLIDCLVRTPELKRIGQTQGLTRLCMMFCSYETTVLELVRALKQLTNLQELVLDSSSPDPADEKYSRAPISRPYGLDWPRSLTELSDEPHATDAPSLLLECLTEMVNRHKLRSLHLDMCCIEPEDCDEVSNFSSSCLKFDGGKYAAVLARATALTRLSIGGEIMSASWGLSTYVALLTNLCSLRLVDNVDHSDTALGLSNSALGLLAQSLTKLTHLDISDSTGCTTAAGLGVLTGLKELRSLGVLGIKPRVLRSLGLPTHCENDPFSPGVTWYGTLAAV